MMYEKSTPLAARIAMQNQRKNSFYVDLIGGYFVVRDSTTMWRLIRKGSLHGHVAIGSIDTIITEWQKEIMS